MTVQELVVEFLTHPGVQALGTTLVYFTGMWGVKKIFNLNPKQQEQAVRLIKVAKDVADVVKNSKKQEEDLCLVKEQEELNNKMIKASLKAMGSLGDMIMKFTNSTNVPVMEKVEVAKCYEELQRELKDVELVKEVKEAKEVVVEKMNEIKEEKTKKANSYINALKQINETEEVSDDKA